MIPLSIIGSAVLTWLAMIDVFGPGLHSDLWAGVPLDQMLFSHAVMVFGAAALTRLLVARMKVYWVLPAFAAATVVVTVLILAPLRWLVVATPEVHSRLLLVVDISQSLGFSFLGWLRVCLVALGGGLLLRGTSRTASAWPMRLTAAGIVAAMTIPFDGFDGAGIVVGVLLALPPAIGWGWPKGLAVEMKRTEKIEPPRATIPPSTLKKPETAKASEPSVKRQQEERRIRFPAATAPRTVSAATAASASDQDTRAVAVLPRAESIAQNADTADIAALAVSQPSAPSVPPLNGTPPGIRALADDLGRVRAAITTRLFGIDDLVHNTLVSLLAGGHVLFEGNPGLGKTMLVKTLSDALGVVFKRGQFTPDLLPTDITGDRILDQQTHTFRFQPGPIFSHVFLADEINRAPAKTQAALLEAMQEMQVTVAGERYSLGEIHPQPDHAARNGATPIGEKVFFVLATQNPLEQEGTYALPEAQLDRFLMRLFFRYPDRASLMRILSHSIDRQSTEAAAGETGIGFDRIVEHRRALRQHVKVDDAVRSHIVNVIEGTHTHQQCAYGASPRAAQALLLCAVASAGMQGRTHVTRADVDERTFDVLNHRIILTQEAYYAVDQKDPMANVRKVINEIVGSA